MNLEAYEKLAVLTVTDAASINEVFAFYETASFYLKNKLK